jgi:small subunit ribosomal protein S19
MSRSSWKFSAIDPKLINLDASSSLFKEEIVLYSRNTKITEEMLGLCIFVYNGIRFFSIEITSEKIGHLLGEFSPTKKKPIAKRKKK